MDCNDFLDRYSDFHDDELGELPDREEFDRHISACPACARYHHVLTQGALLLRELPEPAFREDFRDRLQHRLYLSEVEGRAGRSGVLVLSTPLALGLAAAAMLAVAAAWGPMVDAVTPIPAASLPAITAATPPPLTDRPRLATPPGTRAPAALVQPDFWAQSHTLLYEHSPLYHRNRGGGMIRAGLQ